MKITEIINQKEHELLPLYFFTMEGNEHSSTALWVFYNKSIEGLEMVEEFYKPISLI